MLGVVTLHTRWKCIEFMEIDLVDYDRDSVIACN